MLIPQITSQWLGAYCMQRWQQAVGSVAKYNSKPDESHLTAVKRIFQYLKSTMDLKLNYRKDSGEDLIGYSDADWAGDTDDRHSTSGVLFKLSGGAISWLSKKQAIVALSTSEAEYVALSLAVQEAVWLRKLFKEIRRQEQKSTLINEDNQGAIAIAKNPIGHARTKHIDIRYHYIREAIAEGTIQVEYCCTKDMVADILTKPIGRDQFEKLRIQMGVYAEYETR